MFKTKILTTTTTTTTTNENKNKGVWGVVGAGICGDYHEAEKVDDDGDNEYSRNIKSYVDDSDEDDDDDDENDDDDDENDDDAAADNSTESLEEESDASKPNKMTPDRKQPTKVKKYVRETVTYSQWERQTRLGTRVMKPRRPIEGVSGLI